MTHSSDNLDTRRRRILFRAWHRGTREADLIMGRFADSELVKLSEKDLDDLEALLDAPDRDVFDWVSGAAQVPGTYETPLFQRLRAFHMHGSRFEHDPVSGRSYIIQRVVFAALPSAVSPSSRCR